ncbi:small subunit processome component 20 homolog [Tetranychus urticae]|uniref:small subunit processome component 20 homolog n=1 Tax=Tetranychus urticae TaxID=32264 RepID=UPI00077BF19C|nr:small subunit processome component 20 homolog [Tetranychus urticae]
MVKSKPKKGRPDKTFTFKSFNDHISEIKIDLIRKIDTARGSEQNDFESKFHETLQKFSDFNCTADFAAIKKRLGGTSTFYSVIQVHERHEELFNVLHDSLSKEDSLASDVILELIVALATDIGELFYPYFEPTFEALVKLMDSQDPKLVENIFMALANLFKILSREIQKQASYIQKIFALFKGLFSNKRPEFIRSFAAQSLTYLIRKISKKDEVIQVVLKEVDSDSSVISGVSYLLFEIVKGVTGHLQSCAETFIKSLLVIYTENYSASKNVKLCVEETFKLIAGHIEKERSDIIWKNLLTVCENSIQSPQSFKQVASILLFFVSYKRGELIQDCENIVYSTILFLKSMFDVQDCLDVLLRLTAVILNNLYASIEPDRRRELIKTAFDSNITASQFGSFVESLYHNHFFEDDILPFLLKRSYQPLIQCQTSLIEDELQEQIKEFNNIIDILFKLITCKAPLPILETLPTFEAYPLDFSKVATEEGCADLIARLLKVLIDPQDWELVRKIVNILPHLIPLERSFVIDGLTSLIIKLMAKISEFSSDPDRCYTKLDYEKALFLTILSESIYSLSLLRSSELLSVFEDAFITHLFNKFPGNPIILQGFVFFLQYADFCKNKEVFSREFFEKMYFNYFQDNLRHPKSQVRFLTLMAIDLLNPPMGPSESGEVNKSIFRICLDAEMVSVTLQEYREKLRLINLLQYGLVNKSLPLPSLNGQTYDLAPLYYLLGTLYYNFTPLWQPIQKMIQEYGRGSKDKTSFWQVVSKHFHDTQNYCRLDTHVDTNTFWPRMNQTSEANPKPDYLNHRILLLQIFKSIADVLENNGDDVVFWFFDFLKDEADSKGLGNFKKEEDISIISSVDIENDDKTKDKESDTQEDIDPDSIINEDAELSDTEIDMDKSDNFKSEQDEPKRKLEVKVMLKTMVAFLDLLAQFKAPKKLDKGGKLLELHRSLLQHTNPIVQKAALNCLFNYNDKNVNPYRESLFRLLDDTTFKDEILLFGSRGPNPDEEHVKPEHRSAVIPFVMRILYGKMLSKTGSRTAGKANFDLRRSIVFRFLASCSKDEIMSFLKLSFAGFVHLFEVKPMEILFSLKQIDIHRCIPLKYVQGCLKTLELMFMHFGNVVSNLLPILNKILLIVTSYARVLLDQRLLLNTQAVSRLKAIRTDCFKLTEKFFTLFETYHFTSEELDALFEALLDPMIVNLANESLENPSPLLRLLHCWSCNPRYFILFVKKHSLEADVTPLSCLISLYSSNKAANSVIDYISNILANLLSYENHNPMEDDEESVIPHLEVNYLIDESYNAMYRTTSDEMNLGTHIMIPYISPILSRIRVNLSNRLAKSKRREVIIRDNETIILSHLSVLVEKEEDCIALVNLLIDSINYQHDKIEESAIKALESINNLIGKIKNNARQFILKLCRLFELIHDRNARIKLCEILTTVSKNLPKLEALVEVIAMINTYNPRNPEEPDYSVREEGFSKARKIIQGITESSVPSDWIKILIHNCVFFINTSEDIGLRESSSTCLSLIIKQLSSFENLKHFQSIVMSIIFQIHIKKGMKNLNEHARHEWITVLSDLVKYGKEKDKMLGQLALLSHEDADQDFWSNVRHIQVHRRIRALAKLGNNHELLSKFSPLLLQDYILPVASIFISDLKATKYGAASSYAVDLIGSICCHLPWGPYQKLLRLYLHRIIGDADNHKSNVRILCAILSNFNFDLSKSMLLVKSKEEKHESTLAKLENDGSSKQVLNPEAATRVHQTIIGDLVPKLQEVLYKLSYTDYEYDIIRSEFNHEDEIQRMPIALAMVRLLDSVLISESAFENHIRAIFTRMCNFLKSRLESIRDASRKILCKIMEILGARYLQILLREMKSMLTKGFRFHVLTYTIYMVLETMSSNLKSGDLDECAPLLIEIFHQELFTDVAEEKSVGKITAKCKEAKKIKSYAAYRILGKFVSSKNLIKNMLPLKKILDETFSVKEIKKVTICMEKLFLGLTENQGLSEVSLVSFIHDALEDKIPSLKVKPEKVNKKHSQPQRSDSLLLKPEYKQKKITKTNPMSNVHVLFEYCLRLLLSLFKKNRLRPGTPAVENLGKFVPILIDSLFSKHVKLTSTALRCLNQYIRNFPDLPEFKDSCDTIKCNILVLLDEFVASGANSRENVELVTMCFKTISNLIKSIESIKLTADQLKILLFYVDKDMADRAKQSTAFSLLKAILHKKMESSEIKDIMQKITYIMVQSEDDHIREECRLVWLKYLLNYSLGSQFNNHVNYFTRQLEYPREIGRSTILKLIFSVIKYQDNSQISDNAAAFYIPLAARLINDDSVKCRELVATILEKLLSKISKKSRDKLFTDVTLSWFQADNQLHRRLAAQLFGLFVSVEGPNFRSRLTQCLPLLVQQVDPSRYEPGEESKVDDHQLFQLLTFFHKIILHDPEIMEDSRFIDNLNSIFFYIEKDYLTYPHIWIRVLSVKIVASLFNHFTVSQISDYLITAKQDRFYLLNNLPLRIWNLCKKHCFLFSIIYENNEVGDILVKNLHYIAKVFLSLPENFKISLDFVKNNGIAEHKENDEQNIEPKKKKAKKMKQPADPTPKPTEKIDDCPLNESGTEENFVDKLNLRWLTNRLIREIKREISNNPHEYRARITIFKWIAAIVVEADASFIQQNCRNLLIPLAREITNRNLKEAGRLREEDPKQILVTQCLQLYEMIRNKVGSEVFSAAYAEVVTLHNRKKSERKASQAVQFLTNPVMAMRRKQRKHQAYKESKKRKKDFRRGKVNRFMKRPKLN